MIDVTVGIIAMKDQFGFVCASTPIEMGAKRFFSEWGTFSLAKMFLIAEFEHEFNLSGAFDLPPVIRIVYGFGVLQI